jgi:hypothetical protein
MVVLLTALLLTVLLAAVAYAVDLGSVADQRRKAQNAADPAALAAAWVMTDQGADVVLDDVVAAAREYAEANLRVDALVPGTGCRSPGVCFTSSAGWQVSVQTPYTAVRGVSDPTRVVRVEACRQVPTNFAGVMGVRAIGVCGSAVADANAAELVGKPGILVLGKPKLEVPGGRGTKSALHTHGTIIVTGGTIQVNSQHRTDAAVLHKPSLTEARSIDVVGGVKRSGTGTTVNGPLQRGVAPVADPLAAIDEPPVPTKWPGESKFDKGGTVTVLRPGTYGKLKIENGAKVVLQGPGVFTFNGIELRDDGSLLQSTSAMVFNVGRMLADGGTDIDLRAMSLTEATSVGVPDHAGIAFFQARCKAKDIGTDKCDAVTAKGQKITLKGKKTTGVGWSFDGAFYAANSKVEIKGNSEVFDPAALDDDDDSNDPYDDDTDPSGPAEHEVGMRRSAMVVGQLNVGKGATIRLDTEWPPYAAWRGAGLVE